MSAEDDALEALVVSQESVDEALALLQQRPDAEGFSDEERDTLEGVLADIHRSNSELDRLALDYLSRDPEAEAARVRLEESSTRKLRRRKVALQVVLWSIYVAILIFIFIAFTG